MGAGRRDAADQLAGGPVNDPQRGRGHVHRDYVRISLRLTGLALPCSPRLRPAAHHSGRRQSVRMRLRGGNERAQIKPTTAVAGTRADEKPVGDNPRVSRPAATPVRGMCVRARPRAGWLTPQNDAPPGDPSGAPEQAATHNPPEKRVPREVQGTIRMDPSARRHNQPHAQPVNASRGLNGRVRAIARAGSAEMLPQRILPRWVEAP